MTASDYNVLHRDDGMTSSDTFIESVPFKPSLIRFVFMLRTVAQSASVGPRCALGLRPGCWAGQCQLSPADKRSQLSTQ